MMTKHPRTGRALAAVALAAAFSIATAAEAYFAGGGKKPENDCLIGYQVDAEDVILDGKKYLVECTDCDPACDLDGVNTANGSCTFEVGVCINQSGVEGCTPEAGLDKAKAKVKGAKVVIDVSQLLEGSVCGALLDLPVTTKKNGKKPGKATLSLKASVKPETGKKRTDKDKLTYVCNPRPEGEACPSNTTTSTTTTTSTSITTSTIKQCGNGVIDAGEACDPAAEPTGCTGETCVFDCTCAANCAPPTGGEPTGLTFRTGLGTSQCGNPGFTTTVAAAPYGGVLNTNACTCATGSDCGTGGVCVSGHCTAGNINRIACTAAGDCAGGQTCEASTLDLGLGCLYIGGGVSTVPGGITPDTAPSTFAVTQVCDGGDTLVLGGANTGGLDCTKADGPTKYCANGNPGIGGTGACNSDDDCRPNCVNNQCVNGAPGTDGNGTCAAGSQCGSGAEGCVDPNPEPPDTCEGVDGLICVPTANCFFGPPLPVKNGPLSTCVQNVFDNDASGVARVASGQVTIGYTLSSRVHFTSVAYPNNPCPTCVAGQCDAGPNQGQPCTGVGVDGTTHDCPPDGYFFLAPLAVTLDPLTTGSSTLPVDGGLSSDGIFCPFQGNAGAFTVPAARGVTMTGADATGGLSTTPTDATLVSAFCIPRTGNVLIDGAANLPGPGATSLGGTMVLQTPAP